MAGRDPTRPSPVPSLIVIAAIIFPIAGFFYLVTTFLFAFSGGQYRMVAVVNLVALIVVVIDLLVAAAVWVLRSPMAAIKWTAIASGGTWVAAVVVEWLLSFRLGA